MIRETDLYYTIAKSPFGSLCKMLSSPNYKIILAYHGVQKEYHPLCIEVDIFIEHMKYIKTIGNVISVDDIVRNLGCNSQKPSIAVTFDDAYSNLLDQALPILNEMNIPATIYVPFNFIGKKNEWDREFDIPMLSILSQNDLARIINENENIKIGSHGMNHCRLAGLSQEALKYEIYGSKKNLEDMFGFGIDSIAYPHGTRLDYDDKVQNIVAESGYTFALSTCFGRYNKFDEKFQLRRVRVWGDDDLERFKAKLTGNYDWISLKENLAFSIKSRTKDLVYYRRNSNG